MDKEFKMIQELVNCLSGMTLSQLGTTDEELLNYVSVNLNTALRATVSDQMLLRYFRNMRPDCIYEMKGILNISYLTIYNDEKARYLIIGPYLTDLIKESEARLQMRDFGLEPKMIPVLMDYVRSLPVVPYATIHELGGLVANYIYGIPKPVPYRKIDFQLDAKAEKDLMLAKSFGELDQMRQVELRYETSAALTEAVKHGNLSLSYQLLRQFNPDSSTIIRNVDPLRNIQNMCIIMNTQLRHALEDTGIHPYQLDRLSHEIALHVETLGTVAEAERYPLEITRRYCELVQENAYPDLKPFTRLAVTYIKEHLSDNLTVKGTARALLVNANYLSYQFHQDMGITFIDFVNRERISQAAALLKHTNMQIQQIAASVGYNNTSYFAKLFMKYEHMTPRTYRSSGLL